MSLKLTSAEKKLMAELLIGSKSEMVRNPFSGEGVELCPEAVAVYDLIKGAERLGDHDNVQTGLNIFMKNWPAEYMILLD